MPKLAVLPMPAVELHRWPRATRIKPYSRSGMKRRSPICRSWRSTNWHLARLPPTRCRHDSATHHAPWIRTCRDIENHDASVIRRDRIIPGYEQRLRAGAMAPWNL